MSVAVCTSCAEMPRAHSAARVFWVSVVAVYGSFISERAGRAWLRGLPVLEPLPTSHIGGFLVNIRGRVYDCDISGFLAWLYCR